MIWSTNLDMEEKLIKVVLDTNIIISGSLFGGKPKEIIELVYSEQIQGITSLSLLTELLETLLKKFKFSQQALLEIEDAIRDVFEFVYPKRTLRILKDKDDNRVLEAAVEGQSEFIITGDKELLKLKKYNNIRIITAEEFLMLSKEQSS